MCGAIPCRGDGEVTGSLWTLWVEVRHIAGARKETQEGRRRLKGYHSKHEKAKRAHSDTMAYFVLSCSMCIYVGARVLEKLHIQRATVSHCLFYVVVLTVRVESVGGFVGWPGAAVLGDNGQGVQVQRNKRECHDRLAWNGTGWGSDTRSWRALV